MMSIRDYSITALCALFFTPIVLFFLSVTNAQVMQSTNYRIQADSINFAGGLSSSTNYTLEGTAGEVGTGELTGTSYNLKAGYQQMVNSTYLSITTAPPVTMTPAIPGVSGGVANGSTTVTVTTDSAAGYMLTILASQSPAMTKGADTIADYVPVGAPDFSFTTLATDAHFGYSPEGVDVVARFRDNGVALCNTGSNETVLSCWDGLDTVEEPIAHGTSANTPSGATTTINFRVGIGSSVVQTVGTYTATTTLTAVAL